MMIDFASDRVKFDPTKGMEQNEKASLNFSQPVKKVVFAINGFHMKFSDGDHHVWQQRINIQESKKVIKGTNVSVPVTFLLRDSSGHIDDRYEGYVDVLGIAEVE
jgi:hypothetical protein